jgi:hypothetical protein
MNNVDYFTKKTKEFVSLEAIWSLLQEMSSSIKYYYSIMYP